MTRVQTSLASKILQTRIKAGELDFDVVIATPDAMRLVGQLGRDTRTARTHAESEDRYRDSGRFTTAVQAMRSRGRFSSERTRPASFTVASARWVSHLCKSRKT